MKSGEEAARNTVKLYTAKGGAAGQNATNTTPTKMGAASPALGHD